MRNFLRKYWMLLPFGVALGLFMGGSRYSKSKDAWDLVIWPVCFTAAIFVELLIIDRLPREKTEDLDGEPEVYSTEDAPPVIYTVKIKSCDSPFAWYYERCGELFEVIEHDGEMYITTVRNPQSYIRKIDCEIIAQRNL